MKYSKRFYDIKRFYDNFLSPEIFSHDDYHLPKNMTFDEAEYIVAMHNILFYLENQKQTSVVKEQLRTIYKIYDDTIFLKFTDIPYKTSRNKVHNFEYVSVKISLPKDKNLYNKILIEGKNAEKYIQKEKEEFKSYYSNTLRKHEKKFMDLILEIDQEIYTDNETKDTINYESRLLNTRLLDIYILQLNNKIKETNNEKEKEDLSKKLDYTMGVTTLVLYYVHSNNNNRKQVESKIKSLETFVSRTFMVKQIPVDSEFDTQFDNYYRQPPLVDRIIDCFLPSDELFNQIKITSIKALNKLCPEQNEPNEIQK